MVTTTRVGLTLVAFYGDKPPTIAERVEAAQAMLAASLGDVFSPYASGQLHAIVVGLEAEHVGDALVNVQWLATRRERRRMDLHLASRIVQTSALLPMQVRIGGYQPGTRYTFESRGQHPYQRSLLGEVDELVECCASWPSRMLSGNPRAASLSGRFWPMSRRYARFTSASLASGDTPPAA